MEESPCTRVARIRCETSADFRNLRGLCSNNPEFAGARAGLLGEFLVTDEERFRVSKVACNAEEF